MTLPNPFTYSLEPHVRRHGPSGYKNYESYRDWLRDEFSFRCVFCLNREQWGVVSGHWDIDHFVAQVLFPSGKLLYENLLYVCRRCNLIKSRSFASDPCQIAFGRCLAVQNDGTIKALNEDGETLIEILRLDREEITQFRKLFIDIVRLAQRDRNIYSRLMGYPQNLPDLSKLKPPSNAKPESVSDSFHARRLRGELPETY
jgi:hypothetical protein